MQMQQIKVKMEANRYRILEKTLIQWSLLTTTSSFSNSNNNCQDGDGTVEVEID